MFTKIKADCVFIYEVSPMTQALPGVWYAKKRKIPCYLYVTDLWPENVEMLSGIKNKLILNLIGAMVDYIYKRTDRILTSSESFISAIHQRGVDINKLEFWPQYAEDYYMPVEKGTANVPEIPQDGIFNIIFAGNIGVAQGLDILPKTAKILKNKGINVRFNIVGDGRFKDTLIDMVKEYNVSEMFNFISKQPPTRIPELMSVCDATLICLAKSKVFSITLPAKTQSCLACGIPIIVSADGEIQEIIRRANAGVCSDAGNADMLAMKISELILKSYEELKEMGKNAYKYSKLYFDKEKLLSRMDEYFNNNYFKYNYHKMIGVKEYVQR